jgi:hypothetical protein
MDPLTRFKSVGPRAPSKAAQLQADMAAEARRGATLQSVTVRAWPPAPPADDDHDWDAVIARAKMQAALPRVTRPPRPAPPPRLPPELQVTPPPVPVRRAPAVSMGTLHAQRIRTAEEVRAKLEIIVRGSAQRGAAGLRQRR